MDISDQNKAIEHFSNIEKEIEQLINCDRDFVAFIVISIGIEFLGSFVDGEEFEKPKKSQSRFENGLNFFKNTEYKKDKPWIYKNLRSALVHQFRPGEDILLTSVLKNNAKIEDHLTTKEGKTLFVLEKLFDDFKEAIEELRKAISKPNSLSKSKPIQEFISKNKDGDTGSTLTNETKTVTPPLPTRKEIRSSKRKPRSKN